MFFKCLRCGKIVQGNGLRTYLSMKEKLDNFKVVCRERLTSGVLGRHYNPRECDYFCGEELVAVCIGESDPKFVSQEAIHKFVAHAQDYWEHQPTRKETASE